MADLLQKGVDPNLQPSYPALPCTKSLRIAELLIDNGADVDAKDLEGETALHRATRDGLDDLIRLLLDNGAEPDIRIGHQSLEGLAPLHLATISGHMNTIVMLVEAGADINLQGRVVSELSR